MNEKIIKVFYDNNGLPYKDRELQVHFPIVGSGFLGASNTTKIRFYFENIGTLNDTYLAVSKLPNGKQGSQLLNIKSSDENGQYAELSLSEWYFQAKGDVFIGLKVYRGGVDVTVDEETGFSIVSGDPVIMVTGSIKLAINYAPIGDVPDYRDEFTAYNDILALMREKPDIDTVPLLVNFSDYATWGALYEYVGTRPFIAYVNGVLSLCAIESEDSAYKLLVNNSTGIFRTNTFALDSAISISLTEIELKTDNCVELTGTSGTLTDDQFALLSKDNSYIKVGTVIYTKQWDNPNTIRYGTIYLTESSGIITFHYLYVQIIKGAKTYSVIQNIYNAYDINKIDSLVSGLETKINASGHSLSATINNETYVLTIALKDKNNNVISTQQVDLPLESIVTSATYYDEYSYGGVDYEKVIVITLATTDVPTIAPVGDLVQGLVNESQLSVILEDYALKSNTYTKTEVDNALGNKQNTLVSGIDIKTINGQSVLGSGDLTVTATVADNSITINKIKDAEYVLGKNLFNKKGKLDENPSSGTYNYQTIYDYENDLIVTSGISGVGWGKGQKIEVEKNSTYSVKATAVGSQQIINICSDDNTALKTIYINAGSTISQSFNTGNNSEIFVVFLSASSSGTYGVKNLQVEYGSQSTEYEDYYFEIIKLFGASLIDSKGRDEIDSIGIRVSNLEEDSAQITGKVLGKNIFDKSTMVINDYYVNANGVISSATGWAYAKIPVKEQTTYSFKYSNNQYLPDVNGSMIFLDSNGQNIGTQNMNLLPSAYNVGKTFTTPSNAAFVCLNVVNGGFNYNYIDTLQIELGNYTTYYEPYKDYVSEINNKEIADIYLRDKIENLSNTNIVIMGDSITADPTFWTEFMLEKLSFKNYINLARSGATWANKSDTVYDITSTIGSLSSENVIWNQVNKLKDKTDNNLFPTPDVILICAGTNDQWYYPSTFGSTNDAFAPNRDILSEQPNTILTVADAIRYNCELLLSYYPNVQIIITTMLQRGIQDRSSIFQLADIQKSCAGQLSIRCIDQCRESGIYGYNEINEHIFLYDGTHPNSDGSKKIGYYIAKKLKQIIVD